MNVSKKEIRELLRQKGAMTFEDIYDSTQDEPDPEDLQDTLNDMARAGLLITSPNTDGVFYYELTNMNKCIYGNFEGLKCPHFVSLDCETCIPLGGEETCVECPQNTGCKDCLLNDTEE